MYIEQTAELIMATQMVGFWMICDWAKLNEYYYVADPNERIVGRKKKNHFEIELFITVGTFGATTNERKT